MVNVCDDCYISDILHKSFVCPYVRAHYAYYEKACKGTTKNAHTQAKRALFVEK